MGEPAIKLEGVWVNFNGAVIIEDVNLTIEAGRYVGILGPNGAGKSTLLKVILGLIRPQRGSVRVFGESPEKLRHHGNVMGYLPQRPLGNPRFPVTVLDVVLMGRYGRIGLFKRPRREDRDLARGRLEDLGIPHLANRLIGDLSGGEQQRVFIARALVGEPELLLLDEPTASVDPAMQTEFYEILEDLKQRMAIVLVSHDISAISIYVDKIACLNCQLFYHGSKEIGPEILEATYKCPVQMIAHGTVPHRVLKEH